MPEKKELKYGTLVERLTVSEIILNDGFWEIWESLQSLHEEDYFIKKSVVISWLSCMPPEKEVVASLMINSEGVCAAGLFFLDVIKIKKVFRFKTLNLLRSGDEKLDKIWPEYLMPKCNVEHSHNIGDWLQETMMATKTDCVNISLIKKEWANDWLDRSSIRTRAVSLNNITGHKAELSELNFSKSIKRQLSQVEKLAKEIDSVGLSFGVSSDPLNSILKTAESHEAKWAKTDTPSGFENAEFKQALLSWVKNGDARIYDAFLGDSWVGSTVVITSGLWSGFYISGYEKKDSNKWNVGIWMHCRVMETLKAEGFDYYDFMAGDELYKRRLSTKKIEFCDLLIINSEKWINAIKFPFASMLVDGNIIK